MVKPGECRPFDAVALGELIKGQQENARLCERIETIAYLREAGEVRAAEVLEARRLTLHNEMLQRIQQAAPHA